MEIELESMRAEVERLRRITLSMALVFGIGLLVLSLRSSSISPVRAAEGEFLRVRGRTVIDADGTPRLILGAPLPAPKTGKRKKPASGMLILDVHGTERGGYVTSDGDKSEAYITLDNAAGGGQAAMLLANPDKGATLVVMNKDGEGLCREAMKKKSPGGASREDPTMSGFRQLRTPECLGASIASNYLIISTFSARTPASVVPPQVRRRRIRAALSTRD